MTIEELKKIMRPGSGLQIHLNSVDPDGYVEVAAVLAIKASEITDLGVVVDGFREVFSEDRSKDGTQISVVCNAEWALNFSEEGGEPC